MLPRQSRHARPAPSCVVPPFHTLARWRDVAAQSVGRGSTSTPAEPRQAARQRSQHAPTRWETEKLHFPAPPPGDPTSQQAMPAATSISRTSLLLPFQSNGKRRTPRFVMAGTFSCPPQRLASGPSPPPEGPAAAASARGVLLELAARQAARAAAASPRARPPARTEAVVPGARPIGTEFIPPRPSARHSWRSAVGGYILCRYAKFKMGSWDKS